MNASRATLLCCALASCAPARPPKNTNAQPTSAAPILEPPPVEVPGAAPSPAPPAAPPSGVVSLPVAGFDPSLVSFPNHFAPKAPLLVVAHGAGDTPEGLCGAFRGIVRERGVLLCVAGPRMFFDKPGRYFPDHHVLEALVLAARSALIAAYPNAVDPERAVYAGYSQGATMGAFMIGPHGDLFQRLILVEGGFADWSVARARVFHDAGGARVLFACGRTPCQSAADAATAMFRQASVEARVVSRIGAGHTYGGPVASAVAEAFDWLVAGDPRWNESASAITEARSE